MSLCAKENSSKKKILVVDDEPHILMLLQDNLEMQGFEVLAASDGLEALEMVAKDPPDIIILDVAMPKMNGWDVCKTLKSSQDTKQIPIIFLTAFAQNADRDKGLSLGAARFITKPFHPDAIEKAIKEILGL